MSDWEDPIPENLLNVATVNNQFSNILAGHILDLSTTLKFLNTLTGTPVTDAANMIDVSGAAHNGTYKGTWAAGQRVVKGFGWILNPNGTDNYISLGDSTDFSFGDGVNDVAFTIAGVVEIVASTATQHILAKRYNAAGTKEWNLTITSSETLILEIWDDSAGVSISRITDAVLSAGFHTFTITYSGVGGASAGNGITMYVDGVLVASTATNNASYVAMENTTAATLIGAFQSVTGAAADFILGDFTPPIVDKGTVWTAATVNRFHQYMKGIYNL